MAWPADPLDVEISLYLAGVWVDITAYVREQQKVTITRGRRQRTGLPVAGRCTMTLDNTDGRFASRYPLGAYYGVIGRNTKLRVRVDNGSGYVTRFFGYVPGWPPRWDASERDQTVSITAVGILDRLGRGSDQRSAVYRTLAGVDADGAQPLMYYPCEEASTATEFASAVSGAAPIAIPPGVEPAADSGLPGSDPLPTWEVESYGNFPVPGYVSTGQWIARWVVNVPDVAPGGAGYLAHFYTGGSVVRWSLILEPGSPDQLALRGYDIGGTEVTSAIVDVDSGDLSSEADYYGRTFMAAVAVYQSGANVVARLTATREDGMQMAVDFGSVAGTAGALTGHVVLASVIDDQVMGHLSVVVDPAFDILTYFGAAGTATSTAAMSGHAGEMGHIRWLRHGVEAGIATTTSATTSAAMGPQLSGTVLDDLENIRDTDLGRIVERIDDEGLDYLATSQMYDVIAAITLAYDDGQVLPPWEPQDDQQEYRNDITARRPSGGSYRAVDQDEVDEYGQYATSVSANVYVDGQLPDVAWWLVHLGTTDELVWPAVRPNFYEHPTLLDDWLASDLGDQLWVTGHPSPLAPDTIKQIIEGYTEVFGSYVCEVTAILSPASPYTVAVEGDAVLGKADTDGSVLNTAATSGATTMTVATTTGTSPLWTTDGGEMPLPLLVGGEVVSATAVAAPSTVFYQAVGTVTHASNASVVPGLVAGIATGNMLLIIAAIRNSGAGVPDTPSGYTRLPVFAATDNVQVFAKVATSSGETAPTITFAGGVANATTSAQMARLSGGFSDPLECFVVGNTQLNASAQDIAVPALDVRAGPVMAIAVGWKQDDCTSVAALSSWTEIGDLPSTTGDDQTLVWDYRNLSSTTALAPTSFVVTGGASAISRSAVFCFRSNLQAFTVTRAVNGVAKAHSARSDIRLTPGAVAAL